MSHPTSPAPAGQDTGTEGRGQWGSRFGFIMAAVGSAVGLGNMWRFSYVASESGGAAFVLLYILLTFLVGIPVMIAEFGLGRKTKLSPIGALREGVGKAWAPLGYIFVAAGLLILAYYAVIAGWVMRYALDTILSPWPADTAGYFGEISTGLPAIGFQVAIMAITVFIIAKGVSKGIERVSTVMMPALFLILIGLAVFASTLDGAGEGYAFYLTPSFDELMSLDTLAAATSQAFFSLSLGMGAMLTFASYLGRDSHLPRESTIIAFSDFSVALIAGFVVFPVVFALGLQGAVSESTVGALFIALPGAFYEMGAVGRGVGLLFFTGLLFGAITSTVALLEVVVATIIDEWKLTRPMAAIVGGIIITIIGLWPATNLDALGFLDAAASEVLLPLGGLVLAMAVAWKMPAVIDEVGAGASERSRRLLKGWLFTLRFLVPPLLLIVLYKTIPAAINAFNVLVGG